MQRISTQEEIAHVAATAPRPIGFVPTMGALHEGHAALIRAARAECATVIVSIYVNPRQFNSARDLASYPRTVEVDAVVATKAGADFIFHPSDEEVYPPGVAVATVDPGPLAQRLEGAARPGHFAGVATVVSRLFDLVRPDRAYFGEKDAQQLRVVEWITTQRTATPSVSIRRIATVRDADGLALSSRNARLSQAGRTAASAIPRALDAASAALTHGAAMIYEVRAAAATPLAHEPLLTLEYLDFADPETLTQLHDAAPIREALLTIAVMIEGVRLIDERLLRA